MREPSTLPALNECQRSSRLVEENPSDHSAIAVNRPPIGAIPFDNQVTSRARPTLLVNGPGSRKHARRILE